MTGVVVQSVASGIAVYSAAQHVCSMLAQYGFSDTSARLLSIVAGCVCLALIVSILHYVSPEHVEPEFGDNILAKILYYLYIIPLVISMQTMSGGYVHTDILIRFANIYVVVIHIVVLRYVYTKVHNAIEHVWKRKLA